MSQLTTLIELAEQATNEAAANLGKAIQIAENLKKQLVVLENYQKEYISKVTAELQTGREIQYIQNFQLFINKIGHAIKIQHQSIHRAQQQIETAQGNWQELEKKRLSYLKLKQKAERLQLVKEARRDQLQSDQDGVRQLFYKQHNAV